MNNLVQEKIESCIYKLNRKFNQYPEIFLTEEDIRGFLYSLLYQKFGAIASSLDSTQSIPVHCEVRWYGKGRLRYRSDIVIIDVSTLRTKNQSSMVLPSKGYAFNVPYAIIELKLRRAIGLSDNKFKEEIDKDRKKLAKIRREIEFHFLSYLLVYDKKSNLALSLGNSACNREYYSYAYQQDSNPKMEVAHHDKKRRK